MHIFMESNLARQTGASGCHSTTQVTQGTRLVNPPFCLTKLFMRYLAWQQFSKITERNPIRLSHCRKQKERQYSIRIKQGSITVHENACQIQLDLETHIHVRTVDCWGPPQGETTVGNLIQTTPLRIGQLFVLPA